MSAKSRPEARKGKFRSDLIDVCWLIVKLNLYAANLKNLF